jgi:hypothetical protein
VKKSSGRGERWRMYVKGRKRKSGFYKMKKDKMEREKE